MLTEAQMVRGFRTYIRWYTADYNTVGNHCSCEFHRDCPEIHCFHLFLERSLQRPDINWSVLIRDANVLYEYSRVESWDLALLLALTGYDARLAEIFIYSNIPDEDRVRIGDVEFYHNSINVSELAKLRNGTTEMNCDCNMFQLTRLNCYHITNEIFVSERVRDITIIIDAINEQSENMQMGMEDTLLIEKRIRLFHSKCEDEECGVCYDDKSLRIPCCRQHMCLRCWDTMENRNLTGCPFCRTRLANVDTILV